MAASKKKKAKDKRDGATLALMAQVARNARTALSRRLLDLGLYAGQDTLILALDSQDGQTPGAIAARLGVKAPTITKTITRLSAQGFVRREESPHDGRMSLIFLTDAGREKVKAITKAQRQTEKKALEGLKSKEIRHLMDLLAAIDANLAQLAAGGNGKDLVPTEAEEGDAGDLVEAQETSIAAAEAPVPATE